MEGYVAFCEMCLECEAHFGLWRWYFCVMPCSPVEKLYEVGAAEVCRIEGTEYQPRTPREDNVVWPTVWFYKDDVPLEEPVRPGLPSFSSEPPRRRYSWRPRSTAQEEGADVINLAAQVNQLSSTGLTIIDVMATAINRRVQPLR